MASSEAATSASFRSSCDSCYLSKLKCSRERPECSRCKSSGLRCVYSPGKRPGRRRKTAVTAEGPDRRPTSSDAAPNDVGPQLQLPEPDYSMSTMPGFDDWLFSTAVPGSWMDHIPDEGLQGGLLSEPPSGTWPGAESLDTTALSSGAPSQPQSPWPAESQRFWQDCDHLSNWSLTCPSLLALEDPTDPGHSAHQGLRCACLKGVISLQLHTEVYSSLNPIPIDATLYLQRQLLWILELHHECRACQDGDTIVFTLANIAAKMANAYRTILEEDGYYRRSSRRDKVAVRPQDFKGHCVRLGSTSVDEHGKFAFLYRIIECKLQQMYSAFENIRASRSMFARKISDEPLRLLLSGVLDCITVTKGILVTLRQTFIVR